MLAFYERLHFDIRSVGCSLLLLSLIEGHALPVVLTVTFRKKGQVCQSNTSPSFKAKMIEKLVMYTTVA